MYQYDIAYILEYLRDINVNYQFIGNENDNIESFSSLKNYKEGSITWIKKGHRVSAYPKKIKLAILEEDFHLTEIQNKIIVANSKAVFFSILEKLFGTQIADNSIGRSTYIGENVKIGEGVSIGNNCVIEGVVEIGNNTVIGNNVSIINKVKIGANCTIQSGAVIGEEGFAYHDDEVGNKTMIKHYGGVIIADHVHIGANTCIVRGTIDDTVIGRGSKIDNLCHIAHNCNLGEKVTVIAGAVLCGSVCVGDNSYISTSMIRQQLNVGENSLVGLGAVVVKDVKDNTTVVGNPAKDLDKKN